MIVIVGGFGNHSNRLFQAAHYQAFCHEYRLDFVNLAFDDMREYYPKSDQKNHTILGAIVWILRKMRLLNSKSFEKTEELAENARRPFLFVEGWSYRDDVLTTKYQKEIADSYAVDAKCLTENRTFDTILEWKKQGCAVVGIHIRRGDYREWAGGRYFYDDSVYLRYMELVKEQLQLNGRTVRFVIFSNELTGFTENEICAISENHWSVDHHLMSLCDFLIGPPSTFTLWASYIGKTRYFHITDPSSRLTIEDFAICNG